MGSKDFRPQDYEWNEKQKEINEKIDKILEKIAKKGYKSLTRKERKFLKEYSKDYSGFNG